MMERWFNYCLISYNAHPARDERLNIGIAVFHDDRIEVAATDRLEKLKSLSGAIDTGHVRDRLESLCESDQFARSEGFRTVEARIKYIRMLTNFEFGEISCFCARDSEDYASSIGNLMRILVNPEPTPFQAHPKRTGLIRELKSIFRSSRVLAVLEDGLSSHRIIPDYKLAEGMSADFLLKNGKFHVIETVDVSYDTAQPKKVVQDIAVAALTIEQARIYFGKDSTVPTLVYRASPSTENAVCSPLRVAESQGISLVNWDSKETRHKFTSTIVGLAEPLPQKGNGLAHQARFRLN